MTVTTTPPETRFLDMWYRQNAVQDALLLQSGPMRELAIANGNSFIRNLVAKNKEDISNLLYQARSVFSSVEKFRDATNLDRRIGWDFAIDLDGHDWNETKWIAAQLFRDVILPDFKIQHAKFKFSGKKGIHITIPEEAFLFYFNEGDFARAYPLIPSKIARFFDAMIYPESKQACQIDFQMYTARRLLRCAYSLHDESGLVSVPIWPEDLDNFEPKRDADPRRVQVDEEWLKLKPDIGEASFLLDKVAEWIANKPQPKQHVRRSSSSLVKGRMIPCVESFLQEGFRRETEGLRNLVLFNIVQAVKRFNLPVDSDSLVKANQKSVSPLPEREVKAMLRYHFERRAGQSYFFNCEIVRQAGLCPDQGCWLSRRTG